MEICLVTGGAGFIGSHLTEALVKEGFRVRVLDNLSSGSLDAIRSVEKQIEFVEGDIRDQKVVKQAMQGVSYVLHQAALRAVQRSVDDPRETNEVNVGGTLNLLLAARDAKIKKFLYASSSSAYGDTAEHLKREDLKPQPISPYAASKVMGEYYGSIFTRLYNLPTVGFRYFNVFGPRQSPFSKYAAVVPIFIQRLLDGETVEIHGDGLQSRDFSYIDNIVSANVLAMRSSSQKAHVFNVGCGDTHSILELFEELKKLTRKQAKPEFTPSRAGDVRETLADLKSIQKELNYKVLVNFKDGLKKTYDWTISTRKLASIKK